MAYQIHMIEPVGSPEDGIIGLHAREANQNFYETPELPWKLTLVLAKAAHEAGLPHVFVVARAGLDPLDPKSLYLPLIARKTKEPTPKRVDFWRAAA